MNLHRSRSMVVGLLKKRQYHSNIIDHYENPRNIGSLDPTSSNVGTGLVGAPACGDVMKLNIMVNNGIIIDSSLKHLYAVQLSHHHL